MGSSCRTCLDDPPLNARSLLRPSSGSTAVSQNESSFLRIMGFKANLKGCAMTHRGSKWHLLILTPQLPLDLLDPIINVAG